MAMPRIAFSMIVFNLDYVLEAVLESIYPFASQVVITEGPVKHFSDQGFTTSTDNTVEIIRSFPDPEKKISLIQGQWPEKDEMLRAQTPYVHPDTTHAWVVDADEVYKPGDVQAVIDMLPNYDSGGFRSLSFFGGFKDILTGFEQRAEYHRIQRWTEGGWGRHRPPVIVNPESGKPWREHRHLSFEHLAARSIFMYHYTYVYPRQVRQKVPYREVLAPGRVIPRYFERVYMPWVSGRKGERQRIEDHFDGVHEFRPEHRGSCRTAPFVGQHPPTIAKRLDGLQKRLKEEICAMSPS